MCFILGIINSVITARIVYTVEPPNKDILGLIVLSLVERSSLSQRVPYRRFHCTDFSPVACSVRLMLKHGIERLQCFHFTCSLQTEVRAISLRFKGIQ